MSWLYWNGDREARSKIRRAGFYSFGVPGGRTVRSQGGVNFKHDNCGLEHDATGIGPTECLSFPRCTVLLALDEVTQRAPVSEEGLKESGDTFAALAMREDSPNAGDGSCLV
jgi:hypothetical protein